MMNIRKPISRIVIVTLLLSCLCGCAASRRAVVSGSVNSDRRDSVRVETVREFVTDTVFVEIPVQTAQRETRDSVSHLENEYAATDARINQDGSLYHDLKTKAQRKAVEVQKPVERRDSVVYRIREKTVTEVKEVPRQLTWFQQTQIRGFWAFLIVLLITYTIKIIKARIRRI